MNEIQEKLERELHQKVVLYTSLGGGCIGNALKVVTENGNKYFVKSYDNSKMHQAEANGLNELKTANAIRIPRVLKFNDDFIFLEYIESASPVKDFSRKFGRQFAQLHRAKGNNYGYFEDNFIGSTEQINLPQNDNWPEFFLENRLMFQFRIAERNRYSNSQLMEGMKSIEKNIATI